MEEKEKTSINIWVDADSCPVQVRAMIARFANRLGINTFFVANRNIPIVTKEKISTKKIKMVITENTPDAADNYIFTNCLENDLVITRDIPLATRLVEKKICVINDRGKIFTEENIKEQLSIRNFNLDLVKNGIHLEKKQIYNSKDLNNFSNCLDKILQKKLKNN